MNLNVVVTVTSAITDVCKIIGGLVGEQSSKLGNSAESVIKDGASFFKDMPFPDLTPLEIGMKAINVVSSLIEAAARFCGVENNDTACELALKAKCAEHKPGDFSTWQEYISYLNTYVELPENAVEELSDIQKAAYQVAGSALLIGAVNDKLLLIDSPITFDDFAVAAKAAMTAEECITAIKGLVNDGMTPDSFGRYLRNDSDMSYEHKMKVQESMINSMKAINPDVSDDDIIDRISDMRDMWQ